MDQINQFAVYSDFREGFLIGTGPSLWHYDGGSAIRFATEKEPRTAAARRPSDLAIAVRLTQVDGRIEFEPLPKLSTSLQGTWIVIIKYDRVPERLFYLVRGGRTVKMSVNPEDAKGYKFERDARKAVDAINTGVGLQAETRQKTAQVVDFPSSNAHLPT